MGNNMVQEAVEDASSDMGKVQAAADAISAAIAKVTPWLDGQTWTGSAATSWEGDWRTFYATVTGCLNDLPAAESSVISSTRTQMEKLAAQQSQDHAA
jgi:uncharacterized protein YukE